MSENISKIYKFDPFHNKVEIPIEDIPDLYVPFDDLTGSDVEKSIMTDLTKAQIGKFYSIIADSGSGKSSVLNYLMSNIANTTGKIFAIKLNEFPDQTNDPAQFLKHLLKQVYHMTVEFRKLGSTDVEEAKKLLSNKYLFTSEERHKASFGVKAWFNVIPMVLGLSGNASLTLEKQTKVILEGSPGLEDLISFTNHMCDVIKKDGKILHIVVMIDETDKLIMPGDEKPSAKRAINYFNSLIPVLSKTSCSFIFVMNSQYDIPEFRDNILDKFDGILKIPKIPSESGITKIIEKRTKAACGNVSVTDVWGSDALTQFFDFYKKKSLRHVITACKYSVELAWKSGFEKVSGSQVKDAIINML